MSRIGKQPVKVPSGVSVAVAEPANVTVKGPKGEISFAFDASMDIQVEGDEVVVKRPTDQKRHRALHGLTRSMINNMVRGVHDPFEKKLELNGVGFGFKVKDGKCSATCGFSHAVTLDIPKGLTVTSSRPGELVITGIDKQKVGDFAARMRRIRPPEPYNGKGIKYAAGKDSVEEIVKRKAGKAFGSGDK
jgi:large subunit ribosomal protein L6